MRYRSAFLAALAAAGAAYARAAAPGAKFGAKDFGVVLLAHGGSSVWNKSVLKVRDGLASRFPIEVAFGMADARTIQKAVDRLAGARVKRVIAVPLFVSSHSEVMEQTKFVLGIRKEPSREFMDAPHAHRGHTLAKRVETKLPIVLTPALDDHPIVGEILLARAKEMSREPAKEAVVLVGHGPLDDKDDELWLRSMSNLGKTVRAAGGFASVHSVTLRDDAPEKKRKEADRRIRDLVSKLSRGGRVLVVPCLIAPGGIERRVQKTLDGLFYEWTGKTLLPDDRIGRWVSLGVEASEAQPDMRQYKDGSRPLPPAERKRRVPIQAPPAGRTF